MAKKAAKKVIRRKPHEKLGKLLAKHGIIASELFSRTVRDGGNGFAAYLRTKDGNPYAEIWLIQESDKTWHVEIELMRWLSEEIEKAGFKLIEEQSP